MEAAEKKFPLVPPGASDVETLVAAIRRLSRAVTLEELMAVSATAARRLLSADGVTFVLREGDLCYYADEDAVSPLWKGKRFPLEACISGWCINNRRSTSIRDIYQDERIPHDAYRPTFVRSLAMVPVNRDDPVGAMGAYWADEREVSAEKLALLQTMADASSLAIANVALLRKDESADLVRQDHAHRIKNIFTVALTLVNQTKAETVEAFQQALKGRLQALERAHAAIFESGMEAVDLPQVLDGILSAYATDDQLKLETETADIQLSAQQVMNLALIVNELASNATKYGALSVPEGKVTLSCRAEPQAMHLSWRESSGPPVDLPTRKGFGTRVIEAIARHDLGGEADLRYPPAGFECDLVLPISMQ